jgi:predicted GNAT family acetyltransferase
MNPFVRDNVEMSRYEATDVVDGKEELLGFVEYRRRGESLVIPHTEVFPQFEGKGVATALAAAILNEARAKEQTILPYCPYFSAYIARHQEYLPLVPEEKRQLFGLDS